MNIQEVSVEYKKSMCVSTVAHPPLCEMERNPEKYFGVSVPQRLKTAITRRRRLALYVERRTQAAFGSLTDANIRMTTNEITEELDQPGMSLNKLHVMVKGYKRKDVGKKRKERE